MKKLLTGLAMVLFSYGVAFAQPYDVSLTVDMNDYAGSITLTDSNVYVFGGFNSWQAGNGGQLTANGDGTYTGTIQMPAGDNEYKFIVWNAPGVDDGSESLTQGDPCTTTNFGFTNRLLAGVSGPATVGSVCYGSCGVCTGAPTTAQVTLSVDMNEYSGSIALTDSNVYVFGEFNSWQPGVGGMLTSNGDGTYTGTVTMNIGDNQYKFIVWDAPGVDDGSESLIAGSPCTVTSGSFTNRTLNVAGTTNVGLVCYGSCEVCGVGPAAGSITLTVDMSNYDGTQTIGDSSLYVSGGFNSWCGDCNMMTAIGDNRYTATVVMPGGPNEYKFTINNWADQEFFTGLETCTGPPAEFINRVLDVDGDATIGEVCFEACVTCSQAQSPGNITLSVDMNEYAGAEIIGDSSVFVSGSFNSWCGDCNMMTSNGDGTYTTTVNMPGGQNEYKFTLNNWADDETFAGGEYCKLTTGEFTNRVLDVDGDAVVGLVCYESCEACALPCALADRAPVDLTKSQQPVNGVIDRAQVKWYKDSPQIKYSAEDNTAADIEFWPIRDLATGTPITDGDTTLLSKRVKPNKDLFKWPVKYNRADIDPLIRYQWRVRVYCDAGDGPVSPWSDLKIFNTPDFDPVTGIYTPPPGFVHEGGDWKKLDSNLEFSFFPNPTDGTSLTLMLDKKEEADVAINVLNINGAVVYNYSGVVKGTELRLDFAEQLPAGMYFIQIESNGTLSNDKFIVR